MGISSVWDDFINTDVSLGLEARPGAGFVSIEDTLNSCLTYHARAILKNVLTNVQVIEMQ